MNEPIFNIAAIKRCTRSEGPYKRMAIWFQGCDIGCEGCCNPDYIPMIIRNKMSLSELMKVIDDSADRFDIEGVTLLGGEPTIQNGLHTLCKRIRESNLGVILFTGHLFETLSPIIVENVDLIVDGRYDINNPEDKRNMIGSTNQRIFDISGRYEKSMGWFLDKREKRIELCVSEDELEVNGDYIPFDNVSRID